MNPATIPRAEPGAELVTMLVLEDDDWRLAGPGRRCRAHAGGGGRGCGRPALLELNRRLHRTDVGRVFDAWWPYCEEHTYGRVLLEDGIYYAFTVAPDAAVAQEWP